MCLVQPVQDSRADTTSRATFAGNSRTFATRDDDNTMTDPDKQPDNANDAASAAIVAASDVALRLSSKAGPVDILRGVSLSVAPGQSVGIVGPSGSGKTSLLMVLAGLERATAGQVNIAGHEFTGLDEDARARVRAESVGIVFQSFHLIPTMSALENVALPMEFAGSDDAYATAEQALAHVGLSHRLTHFPAQLSGGEQQRVAIARAIANDPALILADEPTGNLDGKSGEVVVNLLFTLQRETGATLVLVTHDLELAERCDRVIAMADGKIVYDRAGSGVGSSGATATNAAPTKTGNTTEVAA